MEGACVDKPIERKPFIALFAYESVVPKAHDSLLIELITMSTHGQPPMYHRATGDALISRQRSRVATQFLSTSCDVLVMLDHDISWQLGDLVHVIEKARETKGVVAGLYSKRAFGQGVACRPHGPWKIGEDRLVSVDYAGTGFFAVHRDCVTAVAEGMPMTSGGYMPIFATETVKYQDGSIEELSEDWVFCNRAKERGFRVDVSLKPFLHHWGTNGYSVATSWRENNHESIDFVHPTDITQTLAKVLCGEYAVPLSRPPRTVLDIGANCGAFAVVAKQQWPDATVDCYEPMPDALEFLKKNATAYPGITVHEAAVAGHNSSAKMYHGGCTTACSSMYDLGEQDTSREFIVPCVAAKTLPAAEFIKIDTEGAEVEILERLDLSAALGIAIEYHRIEDMDKIKSILTGWDLIGESVLNKNVGVLRFRRITAIQEVRA